MKLKFFIAGAAIVAGLASAVSCQDLSKDLTALQDKVKSLESTVQSLQQKIEGGAVITSVTPTNSGIVITLSNGNKYEITNGTNGKDGVNGKDGTNGKDGSVVTIGEDGNWYIDGKDTGMAAKGENGTPGEYYVPNPETGCFDKYVWVEENGVGAYVKEATEISYLAPGTITAVYDPLTGVLTLFNVDGGEGELGIVTIGGVASEVATIELYNYANLLPEEFVTVTVGADAVFGEGLPGAVTFTKDEQVQRPTASIVVKVDPANYELQPEDIVLVDSEGEIFDQVVAKVKKHTGIITKATTETGLWDVTFELTEYDKAAFEAATIDPATKKPIAFALKAGESVTSFEVGFKMGTYTPLGTMAANFAIDKDAQLISTYHNRATEAEAVPEYEWTAGPKYTVVDSGSGKNVVTGDVRKGTKTRYEAKVGKAIKVYAKNKPEEVKAMYVTLDIKNAYGEGKGDVSEKNAWNSYSYTGLDQVVEGSELTFSIDSEAAYGDEIGFRVFAVNYDGTLIDPDGTAFYVVVGNGGSTWSEIATSISTIKEYDAVQTSDVEVEFPALPKPKGKYMLKFVNDNTKGVLFCLGINGGSNPVFKYDEPDYDLAKGGFDVTTKAKYKFYAYPTGTGTGYKAITKDDLYTYADGTPYTGTITIFDDGTNIVVATMKVTFTKVLPTAVPEGFSVKTGQVKDNVYNCYPAPNAAKAFTKYSDVATYEKDYKADPTSVSAATAASMDMFNVFNFPNDDATGFNVSFATSLKDSKGKYTDALVLDKMGKKGGAGNTLTIDAILVDNTKEHETSVVYNYGNISHDACEWNTDGTLKKLHPYTKELASFKTVYNCVYNNTFTWDWYWGKNADSPKVAADYAYNVAWAGAIKAGSALEIVPAAENEAPQIVYQNFDKSTIKTLRIVGKSAWDSKYNGNLDDLDGTDLAIIEGTFTSDSNGVQEYYKATVKTGDTTIAFAAESSASNPTAEVPSTLTIYCIDVYGHLIPVKVKAKVMPRK